MTGKAHYHVFFGTVGCIPDDSDQFDTRKDAEAFAIESAAELRDAGRPVSGNFKSGYAVDAINRLWVERCTYAECMAEDGWHVSGTGDESAARFYETTYPTLAAHISWNDTHERTKANIRSEMMHRQS
jgi:hypothetical protein